jgi:hypothetical protein
MTRFIRFEETLMPDRGTPPRFSEALPGQIMPHRGVDEENLMKRIFFDRTVTQQRFMGYRDYLKVDQYKEP